MGFIAYDSNGLALTAISFAPSSDGFSIKPLLGNSQRQDNSADNQGRNKEVQRDDTLITSIEFGEIRRHYPEERVDELEEGYQRIILRIYESCPAKLSNRSAQMKKILEELARKEQRDIGEPQDALAHMILKTVTDHSDVRIDNIGFNPSEYVVNSVREWVNQIAASEATLYEITRTYISSRQVKLLKDAVEFARGEAVHARVSGPHIIYALGLATIAAKAKLSLEAVITSILFDLIENSSVTLDEIGAKFGDEVTRLIDSVAKIKSSKEATMEKLKWMGPYDPEPLLIAFF